VHPQATGAAGAQVGQFVLGGGDPAHDLVGVAGQQSAGSRRPDAPAGLLQQPDADPPTVQRCLTDPK